MHGDDVGSEDPERGEIDYSSSRTRVSLRERVEEETVGTRTQTHARRGRQQPADVGAGCCSPDDPTDCPAATCPDSSTWTINDADVHAMRNAHGVNVVRLGVMWPGAMPNGPYLDVGVPRAQQLLLGLEGEYLRARDRRALLEREDVPHDRPVRALARDEVGDLDDRVLVRLVWGRGRGRV